MTEPTSTDTPTVADARPWWKKKRFLIPLGFVLLIFALMPSGADEEPTLEFSPAPPTSAAELADSSTTAAKSCEEAPRNTLDDITTGLTAQGATLRSGTAAALPREFEETPLPWRYIVAAEIDGPGFEGDGQIATWLVSGITVEESGGIVAGNELARQISDWGSAGRAGSPADQKRDRALATEAAREAERSLCAAPDPPVHSGG